MTDPLGQPVPFYTLEGVPLGSANNADDGELGAKVIVIGSRAGAGNANIIPTGETETVTNGTITRACALVEAETDLVIIDLVYVTPASPPNAGVVDTFTMKAGRHLFNVASFTFTGTATLIYT